MAKKPASRRPPRKHKSTSTVGRGRPLTLDSVPESSRWESDGLHLFHGDSQTLYELWPHPTVIVSDGGYGILGFEGDTSDHLGLPEWYEPHVRAWAQYALPSTTLWFW